MITNVIHIFSPASPRLVLGLLDTEEWHAIPGLFKKQIPKKARDLAKRMCESLHGQWLLRNDSVSDKDRIAQDSILRKRKNTSPRLAYLPRTARKIDHNKRKAKDWADARESLLKQPESQTTADLQLTTTTRQPRHPKRKQTTTRNPHHLNTRGPRQPKRKQPMTRESQEVRKPLPPTPLPPQPILAILPPPTTTDSTPPPRPLPSSIQRNLIRHIFKPMTDTEWLYIRTLTDNPLDPTILQIGHIPLPRGNLHSLRRRDHQNDRTYWLNDDIINAFLFILPDILRPICSGPPRIKSFSTLFYTHIANATDPTDRDEALSSAARQISGHTRRENSNGFLEQWLFFPQHMGTNHWALIAFHPPSHHIYLLDSLLRTDHTEYYLRLNTFKEVLNRAWGNVTDNPTPTWNHTIRTDSPRQANSVDCGVYMLAFCILLATNSPLRFSTGKARHWRSRIALLLAHWTPSPPPPPHLNHSLTQKPHFSS